MKKKIIFLCDVNDKIGFGHINRINNLAKIFYLKGYECYLFGVEKKYVSNNFYKKIFTKKILNNKNINLNFLKKNFSFENIFLIIDSFQINTFIQKILFNNGIKWLQFDNLNKKNKKIYANIIVNANPIVNKKDYKNKIFDKKNQLLLLGSKYSIIRDEFKIHYKFKKKSILICSGGGTSDNGFVIFITKFLLKKFNNLNIIIILKKNDPRKKKIIKLKRRNNKISIISETNKISEYFSKSKIAIISGGTILLESLFYKIKRIVMRTAENQKKNCISWNKLGFINYLGSINQVKKQLETKLEKKLIFINNIKKTKVLSKKIINGKEILVKEIIKNL